MIKLELHSSSYEMAIVGIALCVIGLVFTVLIVSALSLITDNMLMQSVVLFNCIWVVSTSIYYFMCLWCKERANND